MEIQEAIARVTLRHDLTVEESEAVMEEILSGAAAPEQCAALLAALRTKGEAPSEIAGMALTARRHLRRFQAPGPLIDTCGTGGDGAGTFNISTATAFVAAGAGLRVAKHGNRAVSSLCGSADVLEALGGNIEAGPEELATSLEVSGFCFLLSTRYNPAASRVASVRRQLRIRTIFNLLGPLTNPASVQHQVIGVPDPTLAECMAEALTYLGVERALVVHGLDGLDELSLAGPSLVIEVARECIVKRYQIAPEDLGLPRVPHAALSGGKAADNATILRNILDGRELGPRRDVVVLNAAAALVASNRAESLQEGVLLAVESLRSGRARDSLQQFVTCSQTPVAR